MANTKTDKKTANKPTAVPNAPKTSAAKSTASKKSAKTEEPIQVVEEVQPVQVQPVENKPSTKKTAAKTAKPAAKPVAKPAAKGTGKKQTATAITTATTTAAPAKSTKTAVNAPDNLKVVKKKATKKEVNEEDEEDEPGKRYFKCITITGDNEVIATGRYSGKKPKQAASKACTKLFEDLIAAEQELPEHIIFGMHECTRASKKKKKYFYIGKRVELEDPEEVPIHLKEPNPDPITGKRKHLLDKDGNKIPKIDPKTGKPMVIYYHHNNDVKKLTNIDTHPEYPRLAFYDAKEDGEQVGGKIKVVKKSAKKPAKKTTGKKGTKAATGKNRVAKTAAKKPATKTTGAAKKPVVVVKKAQPAKPAKAAAKPKATRKVSAAKN